MSSSPSVTRIIGNLATAVAVPLVCAHLYDQLVAPWFSWRPVLLCALLQPLATIAGAIGTTMVVLGLLVWVVSRFRSDAAAAFLIGGVLLAILPGVLLHYLGTAAGSCP